MPPNAKQVEKLKMALRQTQEDLLLERAARVAVEARCAAFGEEAIAAVSACFIKCLVHLQPIYQLVFCSALLVTMTCNSTL